MTDNEFLLYQLLDELYDDYNATLNSAYCQCEPDDDLCERVEKALKELSKPQKPTPKHKPFICDVCEKAFKTQQGLEHHKRDMH